MEDIEHGFSLKRFRDTVRDRVSEKNSLGSKAAFQSKLDRCKIFLNPTIARRTKTVMN
jgi:hypothetical protein